MVRPGEAGWAEMMIDALLYLATGPRECSRGPDGCYLYLGFQWLQPEEDPQSLGTGQGLLKQRWQ